MLSRKKENKKEEIESRKEGGRGEGKGRREDERRNEEGMILPTQMKTVKDGFVFVPKD